MASKSGSLGRFPKGCLFDAEQAQCLAPSPHPMYDCVGFVKAIFTALGRENCIGRRRCGEAGVKGALFAFISTLDTGLPTSTIGLG